MRRKTGGRIKPSPDAEHVEAYRSPPSDSFGTFGCREEVLVIQCVGVGC